MGGCSVYVVNLMLVRSRYNKYPYPYIPHSGLGLSARATQLNIANHIHVGCYMLYDFPIMIIINNNSNKL